MKMVTVFIVVTWDILVQTALSVSVLQVQETRTLDKDV